MAITIYIMILIDWYTQGYELLNDNCLLPRGYERASLLFCVTKVVNILSRVQLSFARAHVKRQGKCMSYLKASTPISTMIMLRCALLFIDYYTMNRCGANRPRMTTQGTHYLFQHSPPIPIPIPTSIPTPNHHMENLKFRLISKINRPAAPGSW